MHKSLGSDPAFPAPTHRVDVPAGYASARRFALKNVDVATSHYVTAPLPAGKLPDAVTVREATVDLASVCRSEWRAENWIPSRNIVDRSTYAGAAVGYAQLMQLWPGFANEGGSVDAHVVRHTPRDYSLFRDMAHGEQYPEMHRRAVARFIAEVERRRAAGEEIEPESERWIKLQASMVPPYDPEKFPNKWRKLEPDRPSCTLTAHLGKDAYSHIHYDCDQARTISVREAARLQSFPDGYVFSGTMNSAFRQIGNAVPPLLAQAIAIKLAELLGIKSLIGQGRAAGRDVKAAA